MPGEIFETPQPVQSAEPKPTNWPKIILAAVLGFALLVGAAYAGYWYGTQQVLPAKEPTPISTPAPVVEDETKDWKTYTNIDYGYTLKYPSSLDVIVPSESPPHIKHESLFYSKVPKNKTEGPVFSVVIRTESYLELINAPDENFGGGRYGGKVTTTEVTVGGVRGTEKIGVSVGSGSELRAIYLEKDEQVFDISAFPHFHTLSYEGCVKIYELMLKTFKFLD